MTKDKYVVSRTGLLIFAAALVFRFITFLISTPAWVNVDEFYYLSRGKMVAQGLMPYTDFLSPYPPGVSLVFSPIHFILDDAWILTRLLTVLIDACNAYLLFRIGVILFNERSGFFSSILYVINPLAVFTTAATMSETYMLSLILLGFIMLLKNKSRIFLSGYFFAFLVYVKYYSLLFFVPPLFYLLVKKRECRRILLYMPAVFTVLLALTISDFAEFVNQTILYYNVHVEQPLVYKSYLMLLFLILMQPHILLSWKEFLKEKNLASYWWYSSMLFIFFPILYEHHFLLTLPASCIIAGNYFSKQKIAIQKLKPLVITALLIVGSSALLFVEINLVHTLYDLNPQHLFSNVAPVVSYITESTMEGDYILSDYPEFPYLSKRNPTLTYVWGYENVFTEEELFNELNYSKAVVVSRSWNYPRGFVGSIEKNWTAVYFNGGFTVFHKSEKTPL